MTIINLKVKRTYVPYKQHPNVPYIPSNEEVEERLRDLLDEGGFEVLELEFEEPIKLGLWKNSWEH